MLISAVPGTKILLIPLPLRLPANLPLLLVAVASRKHHPIRVSLTTVTLLSIENVCAAVAPHSLSLDIHTLKRPSLAPVGNQRILNNTLRAR